MSRLKSKRLSIIAILLVLSALFAFGYTTHTVVTHNPEKYASSKYVTLDSTTFSCNKGMTVTIGAKGSSAISSYTSSDKSIATVKKSSVAASCKNCMNLEIYCKAKGNATITVTGKDGASSKLKVSVTTSGAEISNKYLNLNKTNVSCEKGKTVNVTASGSSKFSKATTANSSLATISKNDSIPGGCSNCYTLTIKCKKEGSVAFTVTGKDGASAKGKVTIKANKTDPETLKADKTSITCTEGTSKEIKLTGDFGKYKSSNTALATVSVSPTNATKCPTKKDCSIDNCPTYKPECEILQISCVKAGSTTVNVESARGTKKVTIKVKVNKKSTTTQKDDVAFEKESYTCDMSKSTSFNIKVKTKNSSIKSIETSDKKVATVKLGKSSKGSDGLTTYTAKVTCLQDGRVNVTAVDNKSKKAVVQLAVNNGGNISLPKSISCKEGETKVINVQATKPNSGAAGLKSYSVGDKKVATVSKNGAASLYCEGCLILNIKCVKEGKTTLTVTSTSGATGKMPITVNSSKIPNKIEWTSSSFKCDVSNGNKTITTYVTAGIDKITEIKSSNSSIASVSYNQTSSPSGSSDKIYLVKITCKSYGSTRIKAKTEKNVEGSVKVTVTNEKQTKSDTVSFNSSTFECQKGKTIKVTATSKISTISKITSSDDKIAKVTKLDRSLIKHDAYLNSLDGYFAVTNCSYYKPVDYSRCGTATRCMSVVPDCAIMPGDVATATVSCIKTGSVTLTAKSEVGAKGTAKLTVKSTLSKAKVTFGDNYTCEAGKTISGLVKITNATNTTSKQEEIKSVKSSDTSVATIALDGTTYYSKSKPTERFQKVKITCVKNGTAKLTATTNMNASGTGKVTVSASTPHVETSIKFDKDSYTCTVGKNTTVKVIVTGNTTIQSAYSNNFLIGNLVYSSSTVDTKTSTTTYTLKMSCLRAGNTTLTAVTKDGKTASATLTSKKEDPVPVKSLSFGASKFSCEAGKSFITKLTTTGGEKVKTVATADKSIATAELSDLFSYNTTGTYAVLVKCLKKGETQIAAQGESGVVTKATLTVTSSSSTVKVTKVTLNKDSLSLKVGGSGSFTATVTPSNATNKTITWSSSNTSVATVDNGKIKAIAVGTSTITAKAHNGIKATATVKVTAATGEPTIKVEPTSLKLKVGKEASILATASNNAGGDFAAQARVSSASSNDEKIATIERHPTLQVKCINCINYLVKCVKKGSATLTFKSNQGAKTTAKVTCEVDNTVPVTSVDVYNMTMHLMLGYAASIPYDIEPSNATNKTLTWKSSNEKVATVNNGIVYAIGEGNAVITATSHNGKKDTMNVSVTKKPAKYMDLDNTNISCKAGGTASIIAIGTSSIKSFKSSNTGVAKIAKHPLLVVYCDKCAAYQVTCVKKGTATITVTGTDGAKGTAKVTVK